MRIVAMRNLAPGTAVHGSWHPTNSLKQTISRHFRSFRQNRGKIAETATKGAALGALGSWGCLILDPWRNVAWLAGDGRIFARWRLSGCQSGGIACARRSVTFKTCIAHSNRGGECCYPDLMVTPWSWRADSCHGSWTNVPGGNGFGNFPGDGVKGTRCAEGSPTMERGMRSHDTIIDN